MLNRSPSTICREIRRNRGAQGEYITQHAQRATCERRMPCRPLFCGAAWEPALSQS
jgi:IS30 family transposase